MLIGDRDGTLHRVSTSAHEDAVAPAPPGLGGPAHQVVFSPDGHLFATSSLEGVGNTNTGDPVATLKVWRAEDGAVVFTAPIAGVRSGPDLAFSSDSATLAVVSPENRIRLLRSSDWHELAVMDQGVEGVAFTVDGKSLLASGLGGYVRRALRRWRVADGMEELGVGALGMEARDFVLSPDGIRVAILFADSAPAEGLSLWGLKDEEAIWSVQVNTGRGQSVAFAPDGSQVATSDFQVFATADGGLIRDLKPANWDPGSSFTSGVGYSRDGAHLAFATFERAGGLRVFRASDGMPEHQRSGTFQTVAWSPTQDRLIVGGEDFILRSLCAE